MTLVSILMPIYSIFHKIKLDNTQRWRSKNNVCVGVCRDNENEVKEMEDV